ncbi:MAG: tyrosine-type recombinase/integrase, partial [Anaerolineales bacterium]|nr:tyrosine-type recombinase/integrase [Anaerolineales bacterium]
MKELENEVELKRKKKQTLNNNAMNFRLNLVSLYESPIGSITFDKVEKLKNELIQKGHGRRYINLSLATLSLILKHAIRKGHIENLPLIEPLKVRREDIKERQFLSMQEINKFLSELPEETKGGLRIRDFAKMHFLTGMRVGEMCAMRFDWVQGDKIIIQATQILTGREENAPKTGIGSIPLTNEMREIIERQPKRNAYVFSSKKNKSILRSAITILYSRHGRRILGQPIQTHTLRRSLGRALLDNQEPIYTVSRLLRHSSITMTQKAYASLSDETERK